MYAGGLVMAVKMSKKEFETEHKKLVCVLKKGTKEEQKKEAKKQANELKQEKKKGK